MSDRGALLERLVKLAEVNSSEARRELLRELTDVYLDAPEGFPAKEREEFGRLVAQIAREMETAARKVLAEKFATLPNAPKSLVMELADDEIAVAQPILVKSIVLNDPELIAFVQSASQAHLDAVAARHSVGAELAEALVRRGNDEVLRTLVLNRGARIGRDSFETIVARAERAEGLHRPILTRADLPPDLLNDMFFVVSAELKRFVMKRMAGLKAHAVEEAIRLTERRAKAQAGAPDPQMLAAEAYVDGLARRMGGVSEALLVNVAKQKHLLELAIAFGRAAKFDYRTARRVLFDKGPEAVAVVSKALRFDRATFSTLALVNAEATGAGATAVDLMGLYDKVPVDGAQRLMRFWQVRNAPALAA